MRDLSRYDGYLNTVVGHGLRSRDPFASYIFREPGDRVLSNLECENLFTFNGIAQKVIKAPADEAVRAGFTLMDGASELDQNNRIQSIYEDLDGQTAFSTAISWDRLYGGGAVLMLIDDGGTLQDPVNEGRIRKIEKLEVFDATDIDRNDIVIYEDPHDPNYGAPEYFWITGYSGNNFRVHESRLLLFDGGIVSNRRRRSQNGWGGRIFDQVQDDIQRYVTSLSLGQMALSRLSQGILMLDGMTDLLQNDFGEAQVQKRLQLIDMARHMMNTIAIDTEDEYDQKNITLAGVKDIMERFENALSASTDIPATILFGKSPDGQNATGHSDFENYYNMVQRIQQRTLRPKLARLIYIMGMASDYHLAMPSEYTIAFNELWSPSEKEAAETANISAQAREHDANAAKIYVDIGAVDSHEVRDKLDDGDEYDIDRSLDKLMNEPAEPEEPLPGGDD